MNRKDNKSSGQTTQKQVLLIGSTGGILSGIDELEKLGCQLCGSVLDAVPLAAKKNFASIVIAMSSFQSGPASALKALRAVNGRAKIILLAQMYEEPLAIELAGSKYNGASLADDYLICPVTAKQFAQSTLSAREQTVEPGAVAEVIDNKGALISELAKLATEDDLTGLKNRRYVREFLRQIIELAKKEDLKVTVLIFDIDDFKRYNDVYGHWAGDMVLKQAAVLMRRCCRGHDVVGRIGGDEFAVVFWDRPGRQKVEAPDAGSERRSAVGEHPKEPIFIAERFRKELSSTELPLLGPKAKGVLTISGGLASFPRDGADGQQLLGQADNALLEAKRSGKNRIYLVGKPQNGAEEAGT